MKKTLSELRKQRDAIVAELERRVNEECQTCGTPFNQPTLPTWTSRNGDTMRLCDMPIPYLEAALDFAARMVRLDQGRRNFASGLYDAIGNELRVRQLNGSKVTA